MLNLKQRLLKLLYDHNEEHVGSCFSCIDIIESIYKKKRPEDIFVLSNGHAAYALYCILEKYEGKDADALAKKHLKSLSVKKLKLYDHFLMK